MAYSADTFVADEQPTTAKWNKLWANDASFNDGTGIATGAITSSKISGLDKSLTTTDSNPYKFRVVKGDAQNTSAGSFVKVTFNTESFDTNNNFASSTYTAPLAGFMQLNGGNSVVANPGTFFIPAIYKNGSVYIRLEQLNANSATIASGSDMMQVAANDTIEQYVFASNAVAMGITTGEQPWMSGFYISRT